MEKKTMPRVMALLLAFAMVCTSIISMPTNAEAAAKVKLSATNQTMYVGGSFTLKVKNPKGKKATYKTSDKKVATVNKKGKVTAKSVGKATISVTVKGIKKAAKCTVTVKQGVKSIQTASQVYVQKGKSLKLNYGVTPSNVDKKAKKMTFKTSKKKIATVDKKGTIKGKKPGKAKITMQSAGGSAKATVKVSVVKKLTAVKSVALSASTLALNTGASETLTATVAPAKATAKKVYWVSSNTEVATVKNGQVTAVADGTATITAYASDSSKKKASCTVTVTTPAPAPTEVAVESVTVTPASLTLKANAAPAQLAAVVAPENATNKTVTWSVDNAAVATVDAAGVVTPVSGGKAIVTATAGGKTATCEVTVIERETALTSTNSEFIYKLDKTAVAYEAADYAWLANQLDDEYWDNNFFKTNWSKFDSETLKVVSALFGNTLLSEKVKVEATDDNTLTIDAGNKGIITVVRTDAEKDGDPCTLTVTKGEKVTTLKEVTVAQAEDKTVTITAKTAVGGTDSVLKAEITKTGVTLKMDDDLVVSSKVTDTEYETTIVKMAYNQLMKQLGLSVNLENIKVENVYK